MLIPGGANTGAASFPGEGNYRTDVPQMALDCRAKALGGINVRKFTIRCVPDFVVDGGEFSPDASFAHVLEMYFREVESTWSFLGRDLGLRSSPIVSVLNNVIVTRDNIGVVENDYVRLLRARNAAGMPVTGSFRVTGVAGNQITVAGLPDGTVINRNGRVRKDTLKLALVGRCTMKRVVVRKIGRPSESYRGRRSKR